MRRYLVPVVFFLLLPLSSLHAETTPSFYVELSDAPSITVDWSKGNTQAVTLHGNRSFVFANGQAGRTYLLIIQQDTTGSRTVTWPLSLRWPGTSSPALTTTASKKDFLSIFYDGANYYGLGLSQNF